MHIYIQCNVHSNGYILLLIDLGMFNMNRMDFYYPSYLFIYSPRALFPLREQSQFTIFYITGQRLKNPQFVGVSIYLLYGIAQSSVLFHRPTCNKKVIQGYSGTLFISLRTCFIDATQWHLSQLYVGGIHRGISSNYTSDGQCKTQCERSFSTICILNVMFCVKW